MSNSTKNRTLVTEALGPLLPAADVNRALEAWASAFEGKPTLVPSIVAGHIARALGITDLEGEIRTRLTQALLRDHGASAADKSPAPVSQVATSAGNASTGSPAEGFVVFRSVLSGIVERLRDLLGADASGMESEWLRVFKGQKLASSTRQAMERWCQAVGKGTGATISGDISTEDMKTVVHGIYVWCCEALGPVEADRIFSDTVEEAAVLPEARGFAPTQLL